MLPDISVTIEEMTQAQFNKMRGVPSGSPAKKTKEKLNEKDDSTKKNDDATEKAAGKGGKKPRRGGGDAYFLVTVRDNGCGMAHVFIIEW